MSPAPYHFYVQAHRPAWRLVRAEGADWQDGAVAADWVFTRARSGADTNPDVKALVDAEGYCLFRLGGTFADVAADLAKPPQP